MKEKTPLENLFDQMSDLLKLVNEGTTKASDEESVPPDIEKRMEKLEKDVDAFTKLGEKAVALSGLSSVDMRKYREGMVEELTPEGKELLDKAKQLQQQAQALEASYQSGLAIEQPVEKASEDPEYGKHRRKKFKRFGSDDKWKPL
ncbi:MAG: hypothetical protein H0X29_08190 [Parachlamydiaceae bacterium]|nr:hypothetical protein [Parachlamydiaceae bacterium]